MCPNRCIDPLGDNGCWPAPEEPPLTGARHFWPPGRGSPSTTPRDARGRHGSAPLHHLESSPHAVPRVGSVNELACLSLHPRFLRELVDRASKSSSRIVDDMEFGVALIVARIIDRSVVRVVGFVSVLSGSGPSSTEPSPPSLRRSRDCGGESDASSRRRGEGHRRRTLSRRCVVREGVTSRPAVPSSGQMTVRSAYTPSDISVSESG